ncbi:MAG: DUF4340 domain-containing protein [Myxococcota bacterium]
MNNRIVIAGVAFLVLIGVAVMIVNKRNASDEGSTDAEVPELPTIDADAVTELTIVRPSPEEGGEPETVTLTKQGDRWQVTAPVEADADQDAVGTALTKLADLDVQGVAASNPDNHERLEVGDNGIKVEVKAGGDTVATLIIGAYRSRNTMVRLDGQDVVVTVAGSIKFAFNKELKDWRNRRVVNEPPERVATVRFASENGNWEFSRNASDEWTPAEGQDEIERFGPTKVQSVVSSIARMRAVNFAEQGMSAADAGLAEPAGTVTILVRPEGAETEGAETESAETEGAETEGADGETAEGDTPEGEPEAAPSVPMETIVLQVGAERENSERYLQRQGDPTIYVISQYLADRMRPTAETFQAPEPGSEPPTMAPGGLGGPGGLQLPGGGGLGGPGGGQIPPELMQKIQQQLRQQAGMN